MTNVTRREKLEGMLAASPSDQMLRYMLAMEFEKEGNHDRSLSLLTSLMNDPTPYVPEYMMAGQQLAGLSRYAEARHTFQLGIQQTIQQNFRHHDQDRRIRIHSPVFVDPAGIKGRGKGRAGAVKRQCSRRRNPGILARLGTRPETPRKAGTR